MTIISVFRLEREGIKTTDPATLRLLPIGAQRADVVELTANAVPAALSR